MKGERPFGPGKARWQEAGAVEINPAFIESLVRDDESGVTTIEMNSGQVHNVKETVVEIKALMVVIVWFKEKRDGE
jgi:hypothetical protein